MEPVLLAGTRFPNWNVKNVNDSVKLRDEKGRKGDMERSGKVRQKASHARSNDGNMKVLLGRLYAMNQHAPVRCLLY
jgi:hypothetical protein